MSRDEEIAKTLVKIADRLRHLESLEPLFPRLEPTEQIAFFNLSAGAGIWENTNCSLTIDLPCESNLLVVCFIRWRNTTTTTNISTKFRIDLDGASQAGDTLYIGEQQNRQIGTTVVACFSNVPTGVHTITVQAARSNVGDAIRLDPQNLCVESIPWP